MKLFLPRAVEIITVQLLMVIGQSRLNIIMWTAYPLMEIHRRLFKKEHPSGTKHKGRKYECQKCGRNWRECIKAFTVQHTKTLGSSNSRRVE